MSSTDAANSSDAENICVVCFRNVDIYSIGVCDHAVCFECSTRMRVLCCQNECPICRQDMPKVIFTKNVEPFSVLFPKFERSNLQERKFGMFFCTSDIQKAYYKVLEHRCYICERYERNWIFKTFQQLKDHMRREHELFYCDICVANLKIFSFERRSYTRQDLGIHRRKGDKDNTSHRGHPLCEFCDTRYMDSDELFRHLRINHLFCHFCDTDGKNQYYNSLDDLKRHFRDEHYFCEEGECQGNPLTSVYRTDIDLKAHITTEHSRYMSKSANKQARTLELEFTLAPRLRTSDNFRNKKYGGSDRRDRMDEDGAMGYNMEPGGPGGGNAMELSSRAFVNSLTPQNFPALGNSSNILPPRSTTTVNFTSKINPVLRRDDFPSLGNSKQQAPAVTISTNSSAARLARAPGVTITRTMRGQQTRPTSKMSDNFPPLSASTASSAGSSSVHLSLNSNRPDSTTPNVSIHVNHKSNGAITTHITTSAASSFVQQKPSEAFPALGKSAPMAKPQWVQQKPKKQESKALKVAPAPQLPPTDMAQFPTLSKGKNDTKKKKTSSVTVPVSNSWVNLNSFNTKSNDSDNSSNDAKAKTKPAALPLEQKMQELKVSDASEGKSKNKKKKNKSNNNIDGDNKLSENSVRNITAANANSNLNSTNNNDSHSNGLVKKRSELKIGALNVRQAAPTGFTGDDFPGLGSTKPPPPPGFSLKPPPGFNNYPSLGVSNDLTFTNSSGQSFPITPSNNYRQPSNFTARNHNLIKKFMAVLKNNEAIIMEFKKYSDMFRSGTISADKYYEHCKIVLAAQFEEVFPELLVLLPDIERQQELYEVHGGKSKKNLVICETCKQIIFVNELSDHYKYHTLDSDYPTLGQSASVSNVWKK